MGTHMPGFKPFFGVFLYHFVMAKLANSSIRAKIRHGFDTEIKASLRAMYIMYTCHVADFVKVRVP